MARPWKITPAVLRQIPALVDRGLKAREIASMVGCTPGSLRVRCSKSKVSLRRKKSPSVDAGERTVPPRLVIVCAVDDHETITLQVPKQTAETLRQQAMAKGLSASTLAATLLKVIAQDGLWDAVLDEEERSTRRPA